MTKSAMVGYPPANQRDWYIVRGFLRISGAAAMRANPDKGIPLLKAKPGVPHGGSRASLITAGNAIIIVLLTAITCTRLGLRLFRRDLRWGADDYAIIVGLAAVLTWFGLAIAQVQYGGSGKHIWDLTYAELDWFIDLSAAKTMIFFVAAGLVKISICLFNRRLTGLTSRAWMTFHTVMLGLISSYIIAVIFVQCFRCLDKPLKQWGLLGFGKPDRTPSHCTRAEQYGIPLNVIHIVLDFALLSVPVIVLVRLKMSMSKRVRLLILFSVGLVSCIASVMRCITPFLDKGSKDLTYNAGHTQSWTMIDLFFGTMAASLPVLNALIPKKWRSETPSIELPEKMARRLHKPNRNLDSDNSSSNGGLELGSHDPSFVTGSRDASTRGTDSVEESNADGTVRAPAQAMPRDRMNNAPYRAGDFV